MCAIRTSVIVYWQLFPNVHQLLIAFSCTNRQTSHFIGRSFDFDWLSSFFVCADTTHLPLVRPPFQFVSIEYILLCFALFRVRMFTLSRTIWHPFTTTQMQINNKKLMAIFGMSASAKYDRIYVYSCVCVRVYVYFALFGSRNTGGRLISHSVQIFNFIINIHLTWNWN